MNVRAAKTIGTWEPGPQKIFSSATKFFDKSFLTQGEDDCFKISVQKRKIVFDSSILLIIIPGKMDKLAKDS